MFAFFSQSRARERDEQQQQQQQEEVGVLQGPVRGAGCACEWWRVWDLPGGDACADAARVRHGHLLADPGEGAAGRCGPREGDRQEVPGLGDASLPLFSPCSCWLSFSFLAPLLSLVLSLSLFFLSLPSLFLSSPLALFLHIPLCLSFAPFPLSTFSLLFLHPCCLLFSLTPSLLSAS